jgi:enoyl-[acyl-carrier protein] reductase II
LQKKAEEAGCDAVVAEGFEAGGHNGREETTTMVLIPSVVNAVKLPVLAAGGIVNGRQMLAAMVMGAEGYKWEVALWRVKRPRLTGNLKRQ